MRDIDNNLSDYLGYIVNLVNFNIELNPNGTFGMMLTLKVYSLDTIWALLQTKAVLKVCEEWESYIQVTGGEVILSYSVEVQLLRGNPLIGVIASSLLK